MGAKLSDKFSAQYRAHLPRRRTALVRLQNCGVEGLTSSFLAEKKSGVASWQLALLTKHFVRAAHISLLVISPTARRLLALPRRLLAGPRDAGLPCRSVRRCLCVCAPVPRRARPACAPRSCSHLLPSVILRSSDALLCRAWQLPAPAKRPEAIRVACPLNTDRRRLRLRLCAADT